MAQATVLATTRSTRTLKSFISRRPLLTYFVLSYAFFWLVIGLFVAIVVGVLRQQPSTLPAWLMPLVVIAGSWMPALAAVIVTGTLDGRDGIRTLFTKFLRFRLPAKWYVAALIPFGLAFVAALIYKLAGAAAVAGVTLSLSFVVALVVSTLPGAVGEEAGWRGFALPRLLERYSPLKAGLVLGIVWAGWHLPVMVAGGYSGLSLLLYGVFFTLGIISVSVVMTWIYARTSKSLVPMVIAHLSVNVGLALIGVGAAGSGSTLALTAIMYSLVCLTAIAVWAAGGLSPRPISLKSVPRPA